MSSLAAQVVEHPDAGESFGLVITEEQSESVPYFEMHQGFELVLLLTGSQERQCQQYNAALKPGNVALVSAWEPHSWRMATPGTTALVVYFLPEFLGDVHFEGIHWLSLFAAEPARRPRADGDEVRRRLLAIGHEVRTSAPSRIIHGHPPALAALGLGSRPGAITTRAVGDSPKNRPPAWETAVRLWVTQILLLLYQSWEHRQETRGNRRIESGHLAQILPALRLGTGPDGEVVRVSLEEAADACGLSVTQFRTVFRRTMGSSFGRFDLQRRLGQAARLLVTTRESVQQIAGKCGFTDRSHLLRMFRRRYGKTPAAFRSDGG
jgi:AraC-like DNA-binding protein